MARATVVKVSGPIVLDFGNGMRFQLIPEGPPMGTTDAKRPGRKPSPATVALVQAMQNDAAAGRTRSREAYMQILRDAGLKGADANAKIIIAREAKRAFGRSLGRTKSKRVQKGPRGGGRTAAPFTVMLREKLQADKAGEGLRDAGHYIRWLADKAGIGLKRGRPVVYRELRAAR